MKNLNVLMRYENTSLIHYENTSLIHYENISLLWRILYLSFTIHKMETWELLYTLLFSVDERYGF
jgi:hypothetical protein